MARLSLSCLGTFQVLLEGQPVTTFKSNKVRALLAYLAVEANRSHRREVLAGLLWPEWPDRDALSNLRYALSDLRLVIGDRTAVPPFLLITRDTLQFNAASDYWLDVHGFRLPDRERESQQSNIKNLKSAIDLYRGSFLEGFSLGDSPAFEEWVLSTREGLARQMQAALHELAAAYEQRGDFEQTQTFARRQIEFEPWDEAAHQQLMRALALSGRRSTALAQYETCRRLLAEELGVEPSLETTQLYELVRDGNLVASMPLPGRSHTLAAVPPPFLDKEEPVEVERPIFVARERELAHLDGYLHDALAGRGRVVFVTGEAGGGKTALLQEFTRRAHEAHAAPPTGSGQALVAASGNCNAYTGIGDPYLPFREILELLTGNVHARWAAGAMSREQARRLWNTLPLTAQALVEAGMDLIDTFVPRAALLERATIGTPRTGGTGWLARLDQLVERKPTGPGMPNPQQSDLFEQYTRVLQALAQRAPLLLVVDDLQWADVGSISLLFHLGRQLVGSRILIVGAYRPEEVAIGREGERHPLEPVVNEFRRDFGNITVDLDQAESQEFVEALLDSEPNRLGLSFREMLCRQTRGHPLFTVELLRGLQERGDLVRDPEGRWLEGPALDWETLPERVDAVIAERIGRLAQPLQAGLRVASVEGEVFTAEVIARVQVVDEGEVVGHLSGDLDRKHRLVRAQAIERLGSQRVSRYRFNNYLFQKYLYDSLDPVERAYLHEDVGNALEGLYGGHTRELAANAVQLARHFREAGITEKAIHYLHQAGERAVLLSAYEEAIGHLSRGLTLLMTLPDSQVRAQQELGLHLVLGIAWTGLKGYAEEAEEAYAQAAELCRQTGDMAQLSRVLGELAVLTYVRAEHQTARRTAEEALRLAQQVEDPLLVMLGNWHLGFILFCLGEYASALTHLEEVIGFYDPAKHHRALVALRGSDAGPSAMAYAACCLWCLGFPDQAASHSLTALSLARELDHPFSLTDALCYAGCLFNELRRDESALLQCSKELLRLASDRLPGWLGTGTQHHGKALVANGRLKDGIALIREGLMLARSGHERCHQSSTLLALADAQRRFGQVDEGLATLAEAQALVQATDERYCEAEIHRLTGALLLEQGDEIEAEKRFRQALEVARRQSAKSWELRAATSLAQLLKAQDRTREAREILVEIYGWFSEGFDTMDLREAKSLLEELS